MINNNKYIGICLLENNKGILTKSDKFLLSKLKGVITKLYIGINSNMYNVNNITILSEYTDEIYFLHDHLKEQEKYQFLLSQIKKANRMKCYEIILFDNSYFGPFYDLNKIFDEMSTKKCDFWSLLAYRKPMNNSSEKKMYLSNFLAIRNTLFNDIAFIEFFKNNKRNISDFYDFFSKRGFIHESYIQEKDILDKPLPQNFDIERYMNYELISKLKYPFLKKSCFIPKDDDFSYNVGESLNRTLKYINENLLYDVDIIWEEILSTCNIMDLYKLLHLIFILSYEESFNVKNIIPIYKQTVVIIHLYYMDLLDEEFSYIKEIPEDIDVIITSEEKNHEILNKNLKKINHKNIKLLKAGPKGRDIAALLVTAKKYLMKYNYLCFIHDKKTSGGYNIPTIGNSFRYTIWENLLKNRIYIDNILMTFIKNKRLGLLAPPEPEHSDYFQLLGNRWANSKKMTERLLTRIRVPIKLTDENEPFALSTSFWCKTKALKKLFEYDFQYDDFPDEPLPLDGTISHAIERSLVYVSQDAGYFSGIVENNEYASLRTVNLQRMISRIVDIESKEHYFVTYKGLCDTLLGEGKLIKFCERYKNKYIYGAGAFGLRLYEVLRNKKIKIDGFIISDEQKMKEDLPVQCYYLSDISISDDTGIIVAANNKYKNEMVKELTHKGWRNFFCRDI